MIANLRGDGDAVSGVKETESVLASSAWTQTADE